MSAFLLSFREARLYDTPMNGADVELAFFSENQSGQFMMQFTYDRHSMSPQNRSR